MSLILALKFREELPSIVVEELDNIIASLQAQVGETTVTYVPFVQRGTITILDTTSSVTLVLPTPLQDLTKCEVRMLGFSEGDTSFTDPRRNFPRLRLDSLTTLVANLGNNANGDLIISWEVTEWLPSS